MNADELYEALVRMHAGLDEKQSLLVSSRLNLLLAAQIKDEALLRKAIAEARDGVGV